MQIFEISTPNGHALHHCQHCAFCPQALCVCVHMPHTYKRGYQHPGTSGFQNGPFWAVLSKIGACWYGLRKTTLECPGWAYIPCARNVSPPLPAITNSAPAHTTMFWPHLTMQYFGPVACEVGDKSRTCKEQLHEKVVYLERTLTERALW